MRKIYQAIIFTGIIFISSCATIFNGDPQSVSIAADKSIKDFKLDNEPLMDSFTRGVTTIKQYNVYRSKQPLTVELKTDDSTEKRILKARLSVAYWVNIYGLTGFVIDQLSQKRFSYPSYKFFSMNDTMPAREKKYLRRDAMIHAASNMKKQVSPSVKGRIDVRFNWLLVNDIDIKQRQNNFDRTAAVVGIGAGLNYYTRHNQYFSVDAGVASTPGFSLGSESYGVIDTTSTSNVVYGNVKYNNVIGRFEFGYGLHLSHYNLNFDITDSIAPQTYKDISQTYSNTSLGISLSAQFRIAKFMNIGVQFQPNIISVSKTVADMKYRSNTSFYVNFVLPVRR